jgi:CRISPR/Cas system CSM-associated protein Csm3 (group 7 of RAMP superfamily)
MSDQTTTIRYTFTGKLNLTGALHIGSGGGGRVGEHESLTDATIVRDSHGTAYIPGSSLRGAFRAAVCQTAPLLFGANNNTQVREDEAQIARIGTQALEAAQTKYAKLAEEATTADEVPHLEHLVQEQLTAQLSSIERLFGTTLWESPLKIPDLYPVTCDKEPSKNETDNKTDPAGEIRHGVVIDRDTGAAADKLKYDFEVLPKGYCFDLKMQCDIPGMYHDMWCRLLALGLHLLTEEELRLGGRIARGVGQVKLENLNVYTLDLSDRNAFCHALLSTDPKERYGTCKGVGWLDTIREEIKRDVCTPSE